MQRRNFLKNSSLAGLTMAAGSFISFTEEDKIADSFEFPFLESTIDDLQQKMKSGAYTSRSITEIYLKRIDTIDRNGPKLNSVIEVIGQQSRGAGAVRPVHRRDANPQRRRGRSARADPGRDAAAGRGADPAVRTGGAPRLAYRRFWPHRRHDGRPRRLRRVLRVAWYSAGRTRTLHPLCGRGHARAGAAGGGRAAGARGSDGGDRRRGVAVRRAAAGARPRGDGDPAGTAQSGRDDRAVAPEHRAGRRRPLSTLCGPSHYPPTKPGRLLWKPKEPFRAGAQRLDTDRK